MASRLSYRRAELLTEYLREKTGDVWTLTMQVLGGGVHPQVSDGRAVITSWSRNMTGDERYHVDGGGWYVTPPGVGGRITE